MISLIFSFFTLKRVNENTYNFTVKEYFMKKALLAVVIGVVIVIAGVYAYSFTEQEKQQTDDITIKEPTETATESVEQKNESATGKKIVVTVKETFGVDTP